MDLLYIPTDSHILFKKQETLNTFYILIVLKTDWPHVERDCEGLVKITSSPLQDGFFPMIDPQDGLLHKVITFSLLIQLFTILLWLTLELFLLDTVDCLLLELLFSWLLQIHITIGTVLQLVPLPDHLE